MLAQQQQQVDVTDRATAGGAPVAEVMSFNSNASHVMAVNRITNEWRVQENKIKHCSASMASRGYPRADG